MTSAEPRSISLRRARQVAVAAQLLSSPRPRSILEVVEGLGSVQMDPTRRVARTEHLVLWSRLGRRFRVAELERLLWKDRSLFEYRAFILPTSQYPMHRQTMRRYPSGTGRPARVRAALPPREPGVPPVHPGQVARRGTASDPSVRGSLRRRLAHGRMERRREEHLDDARGVVGQGRGDDRGTRRAGACVGSRRAAPAARRDAGWLRARKLDACWRRSSEPSASPSSPRFGKTFEGNRPPGWERALASTRAGRARGTGAGGRDLRASDGPTQTCWSGRSGRGPCSCRRSIG